MWLTAKKSGPPCPHRALDVLSNANDNSGAKQEGITFLLIPMDDPGIEVRPIITLGGSHSVNEVYLTDVVVPVEQRVGEEGKGWTYAKGLLSHERTGLAGIQNSVLALEKAKQNARSIPLETAHCSTSRISEAKWVRSKQNCWLWSSRKFEPWLKSLQAEAQAQSRPY